MRTLVAIAALLMLVGCGLQTAGTTGAHKAPSTTSPATRTTRPTTRPRPTPTATPTVPVAPPVRCVRLKASPALRTVSLTYADNHGSFCVLRGTGLFVFLRAQSPVLWTDIQSSSLVLERRPSGVMSLPQGETGAFFQAAQVGTARLTSFEPRCKSGPRAGAGGRCPAPLRFEVTVHVLG
jgi:hypothetical protein